MNLKHAPEGLLLKEEQRRRVRLATLRSMAFADRASDATVEEAESSWQEAKEELERRQYYWDGNQWEATDWPF